MESSMSPGAASFILTMESREGRAGNAFACQRCRQHKVRCVPSDTTGICQRCQKARVECIEHVARRRPAKARSDAHTPTRMRDFDKKLDKLSAIVATMAPTSSPQTVLPSVATLPSQVTEPPIREASPPASAPAPRASVPPVVNTPILLTPGPSVETSLPFWDSINETLSGLGRLDPSLQSISLIRMQQLLDIYRNMVEFFPFIPLPKDSFCTDFVVLRPILLLAIITVASYESVILQLALSREFRKLVMVKLMNGEKSLDLLQGLLVFLSWHHHYMETGIISVPMLLQICVGITRDLGLDNIPKPVRNALHQEEQRIREAKRAYLGCYYLGSTIGLMEPGKARCLPYSDMLRTYAAELASAWEHKSDGILPILIDVCQYMEDVEETFHGHFEQAQITRSQVKRLNDKWESIRTASKLQVNDFKTVQWIQLAARMHLYKAATAVELADRDSTPWATGFQLTLRVTCLQSFQEFLENSLKLPSQQYDAISLVDWLSLILAFTSLSKIALESPSLPGWDPVELQIANTFDYFRDQISSQMPRAHDSADGHEDVFDRFRRITETMKTALRNGPGRGPSNGVSFNLATGSGRTVSLLQDLPLPNFNGVANGNGAEKLPSLRTLHPLLDMDKGDFHWRFLTGTV